MQRERWLAILIAFIWVGSWTCIIAYEWSGESVPSRDDLFWSGERWKEPYVFWGKRHPECRNRFGFWPDGSRMTDDDVDLVGLLIRSVQRDQPSIKTPEQIARDKWADDVAAKIRSCEEDQWIPLVIASAIRELRIQLVAFSLLPPFFIIAGLGLMTRARGIKTRTAGKFIITFGALLSAFAIARFFEYYISDKFNSVVITYLDRDRLAPIWYRPNHPKWPTVGRDFCDTSSSRHRVVVATTDCRF
jgi:hypothetical protein